MADYGLKILNNAGAIQIDSTYSNFLLTNQYNNLVTNDVPFLKSEGSYGPFFTNYQATYKLFAIPASPYPPLIAIQPVSYTRRDFGLYHGTLPEIIIGGVRKTGDNYDGVYIGCEFSCKYTFNMRVYREAAIGLTDAGDSDYGLKIYNAAGELCFDSNRTGWLKIHSSFAVSSSWGNVTWYGHASISNPYYILSGSAMQPITGASDLDYAMPGITRLNNSSLTQIGVMSGWVASRYSGSVPTGWNNFFSNNFGNIILTICYP